MNTAVARTLIGGVTALMVLASASCAVDESGGDSSTDTVTVGLITSLTGDYATQSKAFVDGFAAGLDFATDGTGEVNGVTVETVVRNDNGDATTGLNAGRELLGDGVKLIAGPITSAVAIPLSDLTADNGGTFLGGAASSSDLFGRGPNSFNATGGRPLFNATTLALLGDDTEGKTISYVSADYTYGQDAARTLAAAAESEGIEVVEHLFPLAATDFTPLALDMRQDDADIVYVDWQGPSVSQLFEALDQQGLFDSATVIAHLTPLAATEGVAKAAGANLENITFMGWYAEGAGEGNPAEQALIEHSTSSGVAVEYTTYDGFVAAQMAVRAIEEAGSGLDPAQVSGALSGWSFDSPSGPDSIRPSDHLLITNMFTFGLEEVDGTWTFLRRDTFLGTDLVPDDR